MKLYLAAPMTGLPDYNIPAIEQAAVTLRAMGHDVTTPVDVNDLHAMPPPADQKVGDVTYQTYLDRDLALISGPDIDGIVVLPGWQASIGACIEVDLAEELGKPVYEIGEVPPSDPHATPIAPAVLPANGFGSAIWPGLSKVTEECGELLQVIGMLSAYPDGERLPDGTDLVGALTDEAADVTAAIKFMVDANEQLDGTRFRERVEMKLRRFVGWHKQLRDRPNAS